MATMGFGIGTFYDKPKNTWNKFTCWLGFHRWLYSPHYFEAGTRYVCQKGCLCTKDCWDVIKKRTSR